METLKLKDVKEILIGIEFKKTTYSRNANTTMRVIMKNGDIFQNKNPFKEPNKSCGYDKTAKSLEKGFDYFFGEQIGSQFESSSGFEIPASFAKKYKFNVSRLEGDNLHYRFYHLYK